MNSEWVLKFPKLKKAVSEELLEKLGEIYKRVYRSYAADYSEIRTQIKSESSPEFRQ